MHSASNIHKFGCCVMLVAGLLRALSDSSQAPSSHGCVHKSYFVHLPAGQGSAEPQVSALGEGPQALPD